MFAIILAMSLCQSGDVRGRVVSIADGDTLTVLAGTERIKVRLASIDAPEKRQPFGNVARERLAELCHDREVTIEPAGRDRSGRTIARVFANGVDVNETLVREGLAWRYDRYSVSSQLWAMELDAREARRGLWADAEPVPPWEWRRTKRYGVLTRDYALAMMVGGPLK